MIIAEVEKAVTNNLQSSIAIDITIISQYLNAQKLTKQIGLF